MLRIITWNCRLSFTKEKIEYISQFNPDILIIQECIENNISECKKVWSNVDWYSDHLEYNKHKIGDLGIGIFSNKYSFIKSELHNSNIRYVVPYKVIIENEELHVFSTWTKAEGCKNPYIGQINEALEYEKYQTLLDNSIFLGDFNANKIWDIKENVNTFEKAVSGFTTHNLKSVYHDFTNEIFGQEKQTTSYQSKGKFHIDYCFIPKNMIINKVELKNFEDKILSDHVPMIIDLSL